MPFADGDQTVFVFEFAGGHFDAGLQRENQRLVDQAQFAVDADIAQPGVAARLGEGRVCKRLIEIGDLHPKVQAVAEPVKSLDKSGGRFVAAVEVVAHPGPRRPEAPLAQVPLLGTVAKIGELAPKLTPRQCPGTGVGVGVAMIGVGVGTGTGVGVGTAVAVGTGVGVLPGTGVAVGPAVGVGAEVAVGAGVGTTTL